MQTKMFHSSQWIRLRDLRWGPGKDIPTPGIEILQPDRTRQLIVAYAKVTDVYAVLEREAIQNERTYSPKP